MSTCPHCRQEMPPPEPRGPMRCSKCGEALELVFAYPAPKGVWCGGCYREFVRERERLEKEQAK